MGTFTIKNARISNQVFFQFKMQMSFEDSHGKTLEKVAVEAPRVTNYATFGNRWDIPPACTQIFMLVLNGKEVFASGAYTLPDVARGHEKMELSLKLKGKGSSAVTAGFVICFGNPPPTTPNVFLRQMQEVPLTVAHRARDEERARHLESIEARVEALAGENEGAAFQHGSRLRRSIVPVQEAVANAHLQETAPENDIQETAQENDIQKTAPDLQETAKTAAHLRKCYVQALLFGRWIGACEDLMSSKNKNVLNLSYLNSLILPKVTYDGPSTFIVEVQGKPMKYDNANFGKQFCPCQTDGQGGRVVAHRHGRRIPEVRVHPGGAEGHHL